MNQRLSHQSHLQDFQTSTHYKTNSSAKVYGKILHKSHADSRFVQNLQSQQNGHRQRQNLHNSIVRQMLQKQTSVSAIETTHSPSRYDDELVEIVVISLCNCFGIAPESSMAVLIECKRQIKLLRKSSQTQSEANNSQNKLTQPCNITRVFSDPQRTSDFFNIMIEKLNQVDLLLVDLRPVLNLILLAIQPFQKPISQASALHCLDVILEIGQIRPQIWHWIQYTQGESISSSYGTMDGFMKCMCQLIMKERNLGHFACQVLIKAARHKLLELFLCILPSLFNGRHQFLQMILQTFDKFLKSLEGLTDEYTGATLKNKFEAMGIPNFIISQCLSLLDNSVSGKPPKTPQLNDQQKDNQFAFSLIEKVWAAFPTCLTEKTTVTFDEEVDTNLEQQLRHLIDQNHQNQAAKIIHVFKRTALDTKNSALKHQIISALFSLHKALAIHDILVAQTMFKTLTFLLVEWHGNLQLRTHLVRQFMQNLELGDADFTELVVPLCNVIKINRREQAYLGFDDLEFFAKLAKVGVKKVEAVAICEVVELYMLRKPSQYRNIADSIFVKLMEGEAQYATSAQVYLKQHINQAIQQLIEAERSSELNMNDDQEVQTQIRYLCSHLLALAKGTKLKSDNYLYDYVFQALKIAVLRSSGRSLLALFKEIGGSESYQLQPLKHVVQDPDQRIVNFKLENAMLTPIQTLHTLESHRNQPSQQIVDETSRFEHMRLMPDQNDFLVKRLEKVQVSFVEEDQVRQRAILRKPVETEPMNITGFSKNVSSRRTTETTRKALEPPRIELNLQEREIMINEATQTVQDEQTQTSQRQSKEVALVQHSMSVQVDQIRLVDQETQVTQNQDMPPVKPHNFSLEKIEKGMRDAGSSPFAQHQTQQFHSTSDTRLQERFKQGYIKSQPHEESKQLPVYYSDKNFSPSPMRDDTQDFTSQTRNTFAPSMQSPDLSPIKEANFKSIKLIKTDPLSEKEFQDQGVQVEDLRIDASPSDLQQDLPVYYKQQKTVAIQPNATVVVMEPAKVQTQRAPQYINVQNNTEANNKRSSANFQSYQTSFRTEIFSSETPRESAGPPMTRQPEIKNRQEYEQHAEFDHARIIRQSAIPNQRQEISQTEDYKVCHQCKEAYCEEEDHQEQQRVQYLSNRFQSPVAQKRMAYQLPEIEDEGYLQHSQSTNEHVQRRSSINSKIESNLIPLSLPKTNDYWRGKRLTPALMGDRVYVQGQEMTATTNSFARGSPMTNHTRYQRQDMEMSEKEDEDMRQQWLRHGKLFNKQKQIMIQRMNSNHLLRKLSHHEPHRVVQTKQLGDQDVAVTVQSSQVHPDVYQTQVGIRIGLEGLQLGRTQEKPSQKETKNQLIKLRTQIDDIIKDTLRTDSQPTKRQMPELPEHISEEVVTRPSVSSVHKRIFEMTESLDQDRSSLGRSNDKIKIVDCNNIQTQTSVILKTPIERQQMNEQTQTQQLIYQDHNIGTDSIGQISLHSMNVQTDSFRKQMTQKGVQVSAEITPKHIKTSTIATQYERPRRIGTIQEDVRLNEDSIKQPREPKDTEVLLLDREDPPPKPQIQEKDLLTIMKEAKEPDKPDDTEAQRAKQLADMKMVKRQTALAIKREIRKGELSLKELIDKFYELEEPYLLAEYKSGLYLHFTYAVSLAPRVIKLQETGERCITIDDFIKYMLEKKIKVRRDHINAICEGDSDIEAITFVSFIKLQLLASCGGDKTKLGSRNFKKLMKHLEVSSS